MLLICTHHVTFRRDFPIISAPVSKAHVNENTVLVVICSRGGSNSCYGLINLLFKCFDCSAVNWTMFMENVVKMNNERRKHLASQKDNVVHAWSHNQALITSYSCWLLNYRQRCFLITTSARHSSHQSAHIYVCTFIYARCKCATLLHPVLNSEIRTIIVASLWMRKSSLKENPEGREPEFHLCLDLSTCIPIHYITVTHLRRCRLAAVRGREGAVGWK